jgi:CBS domain-containing protein
MPNSIAKETIQEVDPLDSEETVGAATRKVIEANLPALPVLDEKGEFAGIFGEREFMQALFPGYVDTLTSSAMISRDMDSTIERRLGCREEPVSEYMTTDHVLVEDDYSDTRLAELFLHHRVLIIPIATDGKVHAVVTRNDFFRALVEQVGVPSLRAMIRSSSSVFSKATLPRTRSSTTTTPESGLRKRTTGCMPGGTSGRLRHRPSYRGFCLPAICALRSASSRSFEQ